MNGLFEITGIHFTNKIAHILKCPLGPLSSFSLSVECLQEFSFVYLILRIMQ